MIKLFATLCLALAMIALGPPRSQQAPESVALPSDMSGAVLVPHTIESDPVRRSRYVMVMPLPSMANRWE